MQQQLRRLNFQDLISVGVADVDSYTFEQYRTNGYEHSPINGYCVSCEKKGIHTSSTDEGYRLTNISHGAHSSDFFLAMKNRPDTSQWHQQPIVFIYESPSRDWGFYKEINHQEHQKHPTKEWYWIHSDLESVEYPSCFAGGVYGAFVLSAMMTFKLANVYVTNLVKCSLNNSKGDFQGLASFRGECVKNCYENILSKELAIIQPKVVFAVGSAVEWWIRQLLNDATFIQQLPHPAGRRRGFRDEHYKALYFWLVVRALHKAGIIESDEGSQLARTYLDKYEAL